MSLKGIARRLLTDDSDLQRNLKIVLTEILGVDEDMADEVVKNVEEMEGIGASEARYLCKFGIPMVKQVVNNRPIFRNKDELSSLCYNWILRAISNEFEITDLHK